MTLPCESFTACCAADEEDAEAEAADFLMMGLSGDEEDTPDAEDDDLLQKAVRDPRQCTTHLFARIYKAVHLRSGINGGLPYS